MRASYGQIKIEDILRQAGLNFQPEYSFQGSWGNFSENIQIKYFQELMELCKDVKTKIVIFTNNINVFLDYNKEYNDMNIFYKFGGINSNIILNLEPK